MAEEYIRGEMDISEHKATFDGVMAVSVYSTLVVSVVLLCLTLIFGGGFAWPTAIVVSAIAGGIGGFALKQGAVYWVSLVVLAIFGAFAGGLVALLG